MLLIPTEIFLYIFKKPTGVISPSAPTYNAMHVWNHPSGAAHVSVFG